MTCLNIEEVAVPNEATFNLAVLQASKICDDRAEALEKSGAAAEARAAAELRRAAISIRALKKV